MFSIDLLPLIRQKQISIEILTNNYLNLSKPYICFSETSNLMFYQPLLQTNNQYSSIFSISSKISTNLHSNLTNKSETLKSYDVTNSRIRNYLNSNEKSKKKYFSDHKSMFSIYFLIFIK